MNRIISFIALFLLVFDLKLVGSLGSAFLTFILCGLIFLLNPKKYLSNMKNVVSCFSTFILFFLILILYVSIRILFNGAEDLSYLLTMSKTTLILISSLLYLTVFYKEDFEKDFINVFFVNACICLLFGSFYELKDYLTIFQYGGEDTNELLGGNLYRNAFLAGSGFFGISSLYAVAFTFCLKVIVDTDEKNTFNYLKLLIIAIAGMFAGRVALVCYLLAIIYFSIIKINFKILLLSIFSIIAFIFIINNFYIFDGVKGWFDEMFLNKGVRNSESVSDFKRSFIMPTNEITLIFGDAKYASNGTYYGGSDSGYIRNMYFGGVSFLFLMLLSFFSMFKSIKNIMFIYLIVFIMLFLHFKGAFIFNNPGFFGVVGVICIYFYKKSINVKSGI